MKGEIGRERKWREWRRLGSEGNFKIFIFSMKLSIWNIFHNLYNFFELLFHTEYCQIETNREWKEKSGKI